MARRGHGGAHGGAWKVAYADFVTSMMALFLVLWIVAQDVEIREAVQGFFRGELKRPGGAGVTPMERTGPKILQNREYSSRELLQLQQLQREAEKLQELLKNNPEVGEDMIRFEFLADGIRIIAFDKSKKPFFEPGTATLTKFGSWVLQTIAYEIERYPFKVEVEGHIQKDIDAHQDDVGFTLSADRALSAKGALENGGIENSKFWRVAGYGDRIPVNVENPTSEENRRISIVIRPGPDDALYEKSSTFRRKAEE